MLIPSTRLRSNHQTSSLSYHPEFATTQEDAFPCDDRYIQSHATKGRGKT